MSRRPTRRRLPGTRIRARMAAGLVLCGLLYPGTLFGSSSHAPRELSDGCSAEAGPFSPENRIEHDAIRSTLAPSRLRATMLYRGHEFSSFRRLQAATDGPCYETVNRPLPFDRRSDDPWFAMDKAKHVAVSFLWTLGTQYVAVNKGGLSEHRALPVSITSSAAIGVTKEYYDRRVGPTKTFSVRDLVADGVGIVLAVGVILL